MSSTLPTPEPGKDGFDSSRPADCAQRQRVHGSCAGCAVRELAACSAIPEDEVHALEQLGGKIRLAPGTTLVREGDPRREVHTLVSGMVRQVRLLADGRRHVAGFVLPGDFIGFSSASHYRNSVEAVTESVLCAFSLPGVRSLRERYPEFDASLFKQACGELDEAGSYLVALARMTPVERLAAFLLHLSGRQQRRGGRENHVDLPMTRADIGDHLGLTIETVSRSFSRLKQEGALYFEHPHHIELRDPPRLRELAGQ
jgi:CRP/FNR family transcriptional regulator